jgi:hypothetical protein
MRNLCLSLGRVVSSAAPGKGLKPPMSKEAQELKERMPYTPIIGLLILAKLRPIGRLL